LSETDGAATLTDEQTTQRLNTEGADLLTLAGGTMPT
jgi:hypothetical protein